MKRAAVLAALVTALVLLAHPPAMGENLGSDPFSNLTGAGGSGLMDRYPLSAFALDTHIDSSTLPGASWGEEAAAFVTSILWTITAWIVKTVIGLVVMAFSLDLLSAGGALTPVARAIRNVNDRVLGEPWMVAAIALAGFYAIKKGIIERRHSEAASSLGLSLVFVLIAMFLVFRPVQTVGQVASWTNDVSEGFLVGANTGSLANPSTAKQRIADELFRTQVLAPWAVLNFGGLKHCVDGSKRDKDGYPRPVAPDDPNRTACRDHLKVVSGMGGYAPRFLAQPPGSDERKAEFEAIRDGESPDPECRRGAGCKYADQFGGYHVDKTDSPAVDIQQEGSAYNRLVLALVILLVSLGFVVLFGMLALAIILAQIAALLILAFSPVVLLAAVIPGKGHRVFVAWGGKLLTALVIKAFYSLVVAVLIAVSAALTAATGTLGWLYAFGLLGAFYGMVFVKRKWMASQLVSRREYTKSERTVEKTAGMVAAPFVTLAGLAGNRDRQESAVGGEPPPRAPAPNGTQPAQSTPDEQPLPYTPMDYGDKAEKPSGAVSQPVSAPSTRSPMIPPSPEVATAASRDTLPVADGGSRGIPAGEPSHPSAAHPPLPGSPSAAPPARTSVPQVEGLPALPVEPAQERAPRGEDLAPAPEYRGP